MKAAGSMARLEKEKNGKIAMQCQKGISSMQKFQIGNIVNANSKYMSLECDGVRGLNLFGNPLPTFPLIYYFQ